MVYILTPNINVLSSSILPMQSLSLKLKCIFCITFKIKEWTNTFHELFLSAIVRTNRFKQEKTF